MALMQKANLLFLSLSVILTALLFVSFVKVSTVESATAVHVVISEIQQRSVISAADEFVELYNPTDSAVDLTGWRLSRKTETGATPSSLVSSMSGIIASHSFFLVTSTESASSPSADLTYPDAIAANNTILLYSDAGTTLIDKVGMGTALDSEASPAANPANGGSIERKANSSSTTDSMLAGDQNSGNGEDTDNNSVDFIQRALSQPQGTSSATEAPAPGPTPSPSPSVSPSPSASASAAPSVSPSVEPSASPSASPSVAPSASPSSSPTASPSPSVSPAASPSPSPSVSPSITPSPAASPSVSPSAIASASPSVAPSPSVSPSHRPFPFLRTVCTVKTIKIQGIFFSFEFPMISCRLVRS